MESFLSLVKTRSKPTVVTCIGTSMQLLLYPRDNPSNPKKSYEASLLCTDSIFSVPDTYSLYFALNCVTLMLIDAELVGTVDPGG